MQNNINNRFQPPRVKVLRALQMKKNRIIVPKNDVYIYIYISGLLTCCFRPAFGARSKNTQIWQYCIQDNKLLSKLSSDYPLHLLAYISHISVVEINTQNVWLLGEKNIRTDPRKCNESSKLSNGYAFEYLKCLKPRLETSFNEHCTLYNVQLYGCKGTRLRNKNHFTNLKRITKGISPQPTQEWITILTKIPKITIVTITTTIISKNKNIKQ